MNVLSVQPSSKQKVNRLSKRTSDRQHLPWWLVRSLDNTQVIVMLHLAGGRAGRESYHLDNGINGRRLRTLSTHG